MYIYCISDGKDLCKFGFSNNPEKRLKTLQTGNPNNLQLIDTILVEEKEVRNLEKTLHKEYAHKRVKGEWFNATPEDGKVMLGWFEIHYVN
ncbi:GIY-YIG nuclease family protein [bacterium]|jgi:hypothetical protein|nr:GIY-YIG nuclease family protein [bacterium]